MVHFIWYVLDAILGLMIIAIIVSAVISWLVAFNVINLRNQFAYSVARFFDAVTRPILRPFQRFIPPLGGVDLSPVVALIILQGIRAYLLPWALSPFMNTIG